MGKFAAGIGSAVMALLTVAILGFGATQALANTALLSGERTCYEPWGHSCVTEMDCRTWCPPDTVPGCDIDTECCFCTPIG